VRTAAGLPPSRFGDDLIREAFHQDRGKLTDMSALPAERIALSNFIAGAYGVVRNPTAHRRVPLTDPAEAAEIILIANHILRITARRTAPVQPGTWVTE